jgi:hypothetical protein
MVESFVRSAKERAGRPRSQIIVGAPCVDNYDVEEIRQRAANG